MRTYRRSILITVAVIGSAAIVIGVAPWASAGSTTTGTGSGSGASAATARSGVLRLRPTDDSYTDPAHRRLVNGASTRLAAEPAGGKTAYLRFFIRGVPAGARITSATVTLSRLGGHNIPALAVYQTATTWSQRTLDAANAPARGKALGRSTTTNGHTATLHLASAVRGNGPVSVAVQAATTGTVARVESANHPAPGVPVLAVAWTRAKTTSSGTTLLTGADTVTGRWTVADARLGPLHAVRLFYKGALPASYARVHVPAGVKAFISYKSPSTNTVPFAKSCPPGTRIIFHHEPENDYNGNGAAFVAQYDTQYRTLKAANPALIVGMAAMSYQYEGGRHGQSGAFLPTASHADFYAVDNYEAKPSGKGLATDTAFQHWYALVKNRGRPLVFAEYGVGVNPVGAPDKWSSRRAATMRADRGWIEAHPGFNAVLYWYNTGARGDWRFSDGPSIAAWKNLRTG